MNMTGMFFNVRTARLHWRLYLLQHFASVFLGWPGCMYNCMPRLRPVQCHFQPGCMYNSMPRHWRSATMALPRLLQVRLHLRRVPRRFTGLYLHMCVTSLALHHVYTCCLASATSNCIVKSRLRVGGSNEWQVNKHFSQNGNSNDNKVRVQ